MFSMLHATEVDLYKLEEGGEAGNGEDLLYVGVYTADNDFASLCHCRFTKGEKETQTA